MESNNNKLGEGLKYLNLSNLCLMLTVNNMFVENLRMLGEGLKHLDKLG